MARELPRASLVEGVRFTAQVALPNLLQGLFRRRRKAVAAATRANVDKHAVGFVAGLRRSHGEGPIWVRVAREQSLLAIDTADVRRVLEGSPQPFAADPETKRKGMEHFQPDAVTISREPEWSDRRRFVEAVLDTGKPHRLADGFVAVARDEAQAMRAEAGDGELDWDLFHRTVGRITRRVVLGEGAADDETISDLLAELMDEANGLPDEPSPYLDQLTERIERYIEAAEPGSLVSLFGDAPTTSATKPAGQVPHWMFAMGDTLAANAFRALALIATHPRQRAELESELSGGDSSTAAGLYGLRYLEGCLEEALRLWPTTAMLSRELTEPVEWNGEEVPAGTQVLISNVFNHRDPERHEFADRFAPEEWVEGSAAEDWSFNQFSHGPQGCPGTGIALLVGKALIAALVEGGTIELTSTTLDPERPLPHMLDYFGLRFRLA